MAATRKKKPVDLPGQVLACLSRHLKPGARVRVALSGGVDSIVLLHVLSTLSPLFPLQLSARHVHHGLSAHADAWVAHCRKVCRALRVPCRVVRVEVPRSSPSGLEAAARKARYAALGGKGADALLLAQHLDDQAETVLFQLLRGGEPRALAAMPEARMQDGLLLLRPLLGIPKTGLLDYAREHGLAWVEDDSNSDTSLARNALRQDVLPVLEQHFPDYRTRLAGVAKRMAEVSSLLDAAAREDHPELDESRLSAAQLRKLDATRARNLLAHFLRAQGITPPRPAALSEYLRQLCEARGTLQLPLANGKKLVRVRGHIHLC